MLYAACTAQAHLPTPPHVGFLCMQTYLVAAALSLSPPPALFSCTFAYLMFCLMQMYIISSVSMRMYLYDICVCVCV